MESGKFLSSASWRRSDRAFESVPVWAMPKRFLYGHLVCAPAEPQASPRRATGRASAALSLSRIVLENARSVECRSGITGVKHDDSDAKVIESLDVYRFKAEGAVAIL